jgi:hypothetical protein
VVEIAIGGSGELERAEADIVQSLVINAEGLVGVLNELVDGEGGVVGLKNLRLTPLTNRPAIQFTHLNDGVRNLG